MPRIGVDLRAHPSRTGHGFADAGGAAHAPFAWHLTWRRKRETDSFYAARTPRITRTRRLGLRSVLLIALAVQAVLAVAVVWAVNSAQVRHVRLQGATNIAVAHAITALPLTGCVIVRCDLGRDTRLVEALPAISHATVTAIFPDTLIVTVALRTPALAWVTDAGTVVLASDGVVLGPLNGDPAFAVLHLPAVADASASAFAGMLPTTGTTLDADLVNMAAQLRSGLASALSNGWTLTYLSNIGLAAVAPNGMRVLFGDARAAAAMVGDDASAQTLGSPPALATVTKGVRLQLDAAHQVLQALASRGETAAQVDLRWGAYPDVVPAGG